MFFNKINNKKLDKKEIQCFKIDLEKIVLGEFSANHYRKDWTIEEMVAIKRAIEPYQKQKAKERQLNANPSGKELDPSGNLPEGGQSRDIVAKFVGIGERTLKKAEEIVTAAEQNPQKYQPILDKINSKEMSIDYGYKMINRSESHTKENIPELPKGEYDIILADPPWSYDINTRGSPDEHYDVMTNDDIYNLKIPSTDNCILFLWATAPKLQEALKTIENWGFQYKTHAIWIKDKIDSGKLPEPIGETRNIVAKFVGIGERTLKKAEDIVTAAEQKLFNLFIFSLSYLKSSLLNLGVITSFK